MSELTSAIHGRFNHDGITFAYKELFRRRNRGIKISTVSHHKEYWFRPDPHKNPTYNRKQKKFYEKAALALAVYYCLNHRHKFPEYSEKFKFTWEGVEYTFGDR